MDDPVEEVPYVCEGELDQFYVFSDYPINLVTTKTTEDEEGD